MAAARLTIGHRPNERAIKPHREFSEKTLREIPTLPSGHSLKGARPNTVETPLVMANVEKVIEVVAQSEKSWEDAAREAVRVASTSLRNLSSISVKNFEATIQGGEITAYRVRAEISFALDSVEGEKGQHLPRTGSGLG